MFEDPTIKGPVNGAGRPPADTPTERVEMTIRAAFDAYRMDVIVFSNQSRKTEEAYSVACKMLINYCGDVLIHLLTFEKIRDWKLWLDKGRSPGTVRNYIVCLRQVLKYCKARGISVVDYGLIPVPKRQQKVPSFVTPLEVEHIINIAGTPCRGYFRQNRLRNMAVISLLYASGIRASELCALNRDSIVDRTFTIVGKGGKARLCFIDKRTELLINEYLKERDDGMPPLFIQDRTGARLTPNGLQLMFRNICKRAGMTKTIHPHILRHSFATNMLKNNANMRYLQVMLGHSNLSTTQQYAHVVDRDLQKIYHKHHSI